MDRETSPRDSIFPFRGLHLPETAPCLSKRAADEGGYFHVCIDGPVFDFRKVKI
ncbi:MAG: hypothetical protein JRF28_09650, partial [Deltaproteobacteria bacterium]|nr:hypothetical protein [Deltaproteobacteria bacterium]